MWNTGEKRNIPYTFTQINQMLTLISWYPEGPPRKVKTVTNILFSIA
jgi:hypothetical protein